MSLLVTNLCQERFKTDLVAQSHKVWKALCSGLEPGEKSLYSGIVYVTQGVTLPPFLVASASDRRWRR